ncbi:MAG: HAMP domain-containing sensor histidine kinase [Candidatus Eisenbacteria bacterium]
MTLRTRLFLALLTLALVPTLVFAWFTQVQLHAATSRWYQAGVETALEAAIETNRTTLTRLETTAVERADAWAGQLPALDADPAQRDRMRTGLRAAGLDFAQVYERDSAEWRLAATVIAAGSAAADTVDLSSEIPAAMSGERLVRSPSGVLGAVAPVRDGVTLVTGAWLNPAYFEQLNTVIEARKNYGRLGVLVDVARERVWLTIAALALAIAVGAALLARALADGMTQPLSRLAAALEKVEDGARSHRLPESGARELKSLAVSFNAMTLRLAEARAALARAEREAAWRDLARKLAHEIKNPLTPMSLSIFSLQKRVDLLPEADRAVARRSLGAMLEEIDQLTRLADNFSQYARLPEPRDEALDLSELARASSALHEPAGLTLKVDCHEPLSVRGDRLLLTRALHNLLVNAFEASPAGSVVELVSGRTELEAWVEVRDRGTGIAPEIAAKAFEPYVSTKNRGSGLGLSLVHDIAGQHHGRVTLMNRDGGGALARLTLPLA